MKIILESPINKYYVQTLGMIFFPGEHFGKDDPSDESETPSLYVKSTEEENGIRVSVEKKGDAVTVTRGGSTLAFRRGARTAFDYRTAYGILPTEAYTEDITWQEKGSTRLLTLVYVAVFGGMAQKNEMRFKITV